MEMGNTPSATGSMEPQIRFLIACPRSGSTLLMRIFAESPDCAVSSRLILMSHTCLKEPFRPRPYHENMNKQNLPSWQRREVLKRCPSEVCKAYLTIIIMCLIVISRADAGEP